MCEFKLVKAKKEASKIRSWIKHYGECAAKNQITKHLVNIVVDAKGLISRQLTNYFSLSIIKIFKKKVYAGLSDSLMILVQSKEVILADGSKRLVVGNS